MDGDKLFHGEAFVQALELGHGDGGQGARPVSSSAPEARGNLLVNPGFEETKGGATAALGNRKDATGWNWQFAGPAKSYIWQEADYIIHPQWGLPEFHSGKGAIRTHSDGNAHTMISQDVEVSPKTPYTASVWVLAADLNGKGFGQNPKDSAGLIVCELNDTGKVICTHPKLEIKKAGPYQQLTARFTTSPSTAQVRFILDTVIHCPYQEGHVTYDDCSLAQEKQ
jgi:hypothetical protein